MKMTKIKIFIRKVMKFIGITFIYFTFVYMFVAYISGEYDIRYWWPWQQVILITAMVCFSFCNIKEIFFTKKNNDIKL